MRGSLSKRFLLRHNPAGELKVRLLGLFDRIAASARRGVLGAQVRLADDSARAKRSGSSAATARARARSSSSSPGIHRPTGGELLVARGTRIGSMIELGTGFHPELTGQENVLLNTSIHGLSRARVARHLRRGRGLFRPAHFMDVPLKNYSSGMHMRLGLRDRRQRSIPTCCCSTRSSRSATRTSRSSAWRR